VSESGKLTATDYYPGVASPVITSHVAARRGGRSAYQRRPHTRPEIVTPVAIGIGDGALIGSPVVIPAAVTRAQADCSRGLV
jgi:hypothetical protein